MWDPRENKKVWHVEAHGNNKNLKGVWTGENNIITTGWNKNHQRNVKLWDIRKDESVFKQTIDNASGVLFP